MPKTSVAEWCFFKGGDATAFYERVREIGYDAIEMPSDPAAARRVGLSVLNLVGPGDLNQVEHHAAARESLKATLDRAAACGATQVIVFSGNRTEQSVEAGRMNVTRFLAESAPLAAAAGVTLTLEVFNTFDHPNYEADNSAYALKVVQDVASPNVKVLFDAYHMHRMGEDVKRVLRDNADAIAHVHLAGSPRRDLFDEQQALGVASLIRAGREAGYAGYWGVEFLPKGEGELAEALDLLRRADPNTSF